MTVKLQPVRDERLSDKVAQQLVQAIRSGSLCIGDKLPPEAQLAEQLGISRGILREALTVLEVRGYLQRSPKGGTVIKSDKEGDLANNLATQLRKATYLDLLEFREAMECRIVEKVIDNATPEQLHALQAMLDAPPQGPGSVDYYFHYRLAELSGNVLFSSFIDTYYDVIDEIRQVSLQTGSRAEAIYLEHTNILTALHARDKTAAKKAVRQHLKAVTLSVQRNL
ncbi:MAG: FadR/GntR family transcriptional regulator [Candidatus Limiplasma sp.]|nr:FadR/GntR family transcriptional regulator [Candidatus Limiplasma sp.]MEA5145262.1 FadR/GntR family transcriptional regulator [Candidatus Limiplasma sp.]